MVDDIMDRKLFGEYGTTTGFYLRFSHQFFAVREAARLPCFTNRIADYW
jgi:hypothetical protein